MECLSYNYTHSRWDGTASSRVTSLGGRYDYTFDGHDRLVEADYTPGEDSPADEDFSTEYSYNEVSAPLSVKRMGVNNILPGVDGAPVEAFGVLDDLAYSWDGVLLSGVEATANGSDFLGRTGFRLSGTGGGGATFSWNDAGLLYSDSSRGITRTAYNRLALPTSVTFADKSHVDYSYSATGELLSVTTYALVDGRKRPVKVSERSYVGDFVFEGDSLTVVNFPGGYFDGDGQPHFRHADWQGNVAMVTDRNGEVEQHVGYYPYGEPWREPTGQNRLFGGKERMRDGGLNDYDFVARRLNSALALWSTPDPLAQDFASTNPYAYCAANPIRFIDPSGCILQITGDDVDSAMKQLKQATQGIKLKKDKNGNITYKPIKGEKLNDNANKLIEIINDSEITVSITTDKTQPTSYFAGAYMGNNYDSESNTVETSQQVCPSMLGKMSDTMGKPGQDMMHEVTESYEGGKMAMDEKRSSPKAGENGSTYDEAHKRATPQTATVQCYPHIVSNISIGSKTYSIGINLFYINTYLFDGKSRDKISRILHYESFQIIH